jgi:5-methylcytosine-specific restriction protein A
MALRPLNHCTTPGCPGRAEKGRCAPCRRKQVATAPNKGPRYGGTWPARRLEYLFAHPRCILCSMQASVPDHYPLDRRTLIAMLVGDPDADEYLRPLCKHCHDIETAIHQPGGWHRDRSRWQH